MILKWNIVGYIIRQMTAFREQFINILVPDDEHFAWYKKCFTAVNKKILHEKAMAQKYLVFSNSLFCFTKLLLVRTWDGMDGSARTKNI